MTDPAAATVPLKVLRVIARLNIGGPARHVVLANAGLAARGYETLLVHGSVGAGEGALEHLARECGLPTCKLDGLGRDVKVTGDLVSFCRLVRIVFREAPDIVHTHTAKAGTLGRLAALLFNATRGRRRRCLVVHTFHGHVLSGYFRPAATALVRFAERSLARVTDRVVAISPRQREDLVGRFAIVDNARAVVVPLGLDLDALLTLGDDNGSLRAQCGIPADAIVIGYVGRFVPIKDLATLARAFADAATRNPKLWLVFAGDGQTRPEVEALVAELAISDRVRFLGWSEDLARIYAAIDICALSSLNEGTPVAAIEAMAAGKPVVATAVGGVPDVVQDGTTGLLVPPANPAALAVALLRLADNEPQRRRFGVAARRDAAARYSHHRLVDDLDELYRTALAAKRDRRLNAPDPVARIAVTGGATHDQAR